MIQPHNHLGHQRQVQPENEVQLYVPLCASTQQGKDSQEHPDGSGFANIE